MLIIIQPNVRMIADGAFAGCTGLERIAIRSGRPAVCRVGQGWPSGDPLGATENRVMRMDAPQQIVTGRLTWRSRPVTLDLHKLYTSAIIWV